MYVYVYCIYTHAIYVYIGVIHTPSLSIRLVERVFRRGYYYLWLEDAL